MKEEVTRVGKGVARAGEKAALATIGAVGQVRRMKGIRSPDEIINPRMKFLYLPVSNKMSPIGRKIENPMELYFGRKRNRR